ncbi:MAG: protein translocase subunit SecF [Treponema sp.]|jgi:preprotein translocase subunit SecF|nr:protein translocase subunit SecF [Treponema sp.]
MKRLIPFSKYFLPAAVFSSVLAVVSVIGYFAKGGFNLGVDFQAGLIQEIQFAPTAFQMTYSGRGNAAVSFDRNNLYIVITGSGTEPITHSFPFGTYETLDSLAVGLGTVENLQAMIIAPGTTQTQWLVESAQGNPQLGSKPFLVHYLAPDSERIPIENVRASLSSLGTVAVQVLGNPGERRFMLRMQDSETGEQQVPAEKIISALEEYFGTGSIAVTRSDYVGSRFSKQLTDQAWKLMVLTLLLILGYASIRFKPQFAMGAVIAIAHDALITVGFVTWSRMEFNTTTIAAILTILGYSINDTIVVFDRVRETMRVYPEDTFDNVLNRALSETLGRTIITTSTTMLAVLSLFIFTTGSMKDFAFALLIGMISGVYSTIFIAVGFVNFWDVYTKKQAKKKLLGNVSVQSKTV